MGIWLDAIERRKIKMRVIVVYTLITVLVMAFSFGEALAYDRNNVMLALPFDEGEGNVTKDLSPFGNDGGLRQGPQWVEGKFGKALRFDGVDDYVVIPHSKSFDITDSITIAAWVKLSGSEEQNGIGYIVTKGPLFRSGIYRLYANTNGTFGMNVKRHGDPRREGGPSVAAKPDFGHSFDGEWHHVAGTFDGIFPLPQAFVLAKWGCASPNSLLRTPVQCWQLDLPSPSCCRSQSARPVNLLQQGFSGSSQ